MSNYPDNTNHLAEHVRAELERQRAAGILERGRRERPAPIAPVPFSDPPPEPARAEGRNAARFALVPEPINTADLSARARSVALALCWARNRQSGHCVLRYPKLARMSGQSVKSTKRAVRELRQQGLIEVEQRRRDDGGHGGNRYRIRGYGDD